MSKETHYVRDGSGNVLAIYENEVLDELVIYGSSRLGSYNGKTLEGKRTLGNKKYELSNHLGNVLAVISDNKIGIDNDADLVADYYEPLVISESDYYPFGMAMKERSFSNEEYRFGFNTQEKSTELGEGTYTAEFWQYDSKIARRWNNDPKPNTSISVYAAFAGNPIMFTDHLGDSIWPVPTKYKKWKPRVSSWYGGPRTCKGCSKYHKGLDINYGSGMDDYGAPVQSTHDGTVVFVKNTTSRSGRYVTIQSEDGKFQTLYFHFSKISVAEGDKVSEGQKIGEIGGSGKGKELGYASHLHYGMKKINTKGKYDWFNPTDDKGNSIGNIVDPQTWIEDEFADYEVNLNEVVVTSSSQLTSKELLEEAKALNRNIEKKQKGLRSIFRFLKKNKKSKE